MKHVNGAKVRGSHTTVIDPAVPKLKQTQQIRGVKGVQNGPIKLGIAAKGRSYKITVVDSTTIRLDVITPGSKQTFTVHTLPEQAKPVSKRLDDVWCGF